MKEKACLIFDMDGTLWDCTKQILESGNEIIEKELGYKNHLTQEIMESVMGLEIEEIADIYFPMLEPSKKMEVIYKVMNHENEYLSKHGGTLYPNVESTLEVLSKKYDLMIVTNAQIGYSKAMFEAHDLAKYFVDDLTYGETLQPKGQNIKTIMKRNGYTHAFYIGDTQKDQEACEFAGIPFVYASYGFGSVETYDYKIDSFQELIDLFM